MHGEQQSVTRRDWDDDFVLKRQFSGNIEKRIHWKFHWLFSLVLLPAFDGRPGRTNINATQDIPVPNSMTPKEGKHFLRTFLVEYHSSSSFSNFIQTNFQYRCIGCC